MNDYRKPAVLVGVLYIIGTLAGILSVVVTQPALAVPDYLAQISAHENQIVIGALLVLAMVFALALVPVLLYPILKKYNPTLALGYLIFRGALETVAGMALALSWLFMIIVSKEYVAAGAPASSYFQTLGALFPRGNDPISNLMVIVFSLDALMLYTALYQSRLIPRWISVWGFIAILLHFSTAFVYLFHLIDADISIINLPILIQEMVMAVWLIARGFNPAPSRLAQTNTAAGLA